MRCFESIFVHFRGDLPFSVILQKPTSEIENGHNQGRRGRHLCHLFVTYFITWKIFFGRPEAGHKIEKISGRLPAILPCFSEFSP